MQIGALAFSTSPAAYINISSGISISSHAPWGSIDIRNNAAKRMLRLLNAGAAKINFYESSCSVNTVWYLNVVQESPGGDSLTLHSKVDCAVLHCEFHVLRPRWTWSWSRTKRRDQQEPCSLKEATYQLGNILFSFVLNTWVNVIYSLFLKKKLGVGLL